MYSSSVSESRYVGRFAPSPTGLLHMGSLMAAVASFLEARIRGGQWLLRIEDLDPPREFAGAANSFLQTLSRFGLCWDGEPVWQSSRSQRYEEVLAILLEQGLAYPCRCTRKMLQQDGLIGVDGMRYSGRCRAAGLLHEGRVAYRLRVPDAVCVVHDRVQGNITQNLQADVGDFVLKRADQYWAYQLAVVVDDADTGVTHIVRGADLLDSTPRQRYLQQILGLPQPEYLHIPVIANERGEKLSKQTLAPALRSGAEVTQLWQALYLLWQSPPERLRSGSLEQLWEWALQSWDVRKIPAKRSVAVTLDEEFQYKFQ
ncbi:tRNA glutamyl-Q(34) synthetase GluQRS [Chitinibacter sp. S2-10]|uniref:tRNA glutamyl-Q(34) synthetase GluQRS n=1 Tax=Chitinibacter sp. S2-10 TaxID=3373597 RepID=UPI00397758B2